MYGDVSNIIAPEAEMTSDLIFFNQKCRTMKQRVNVPDIFSGVKPRGKKGTGGRQEISLVGNNNKITP